MLHREQLASFRIQLVRILEGYPNIILTEMLLASQQLREVPHWYGRMPLVK